jgi:hypothetical protein
LLKRSHSRKLKSAQIDFFVMLFGLVADIN